MITDRISESFVSSLSDEEILSVIFYTKRIIRLKDKQYAEKFFDICFFLFDNDSEKTSEYLQTVIDMYFNEYMKRRIN